MGARPCADRGARVRIEGLMPQPVYYLASFAFVLGVLVFVHELGHFLAAKRVGIRVLKFQLGFNPTVVSVRRGDTEYGIGALPLGGYVKMAGESPEDVERDERGQVMKRSDEFLAKSKWERFQVLIMGPVMNILLAFVLTAVVLYQGVDQPSFQNQPVVIGAVPEDSPAAKFDVRPGDRILAVQGHDVDTWEQFFLAIGTRPGREVSRKIRRDGVEITKTITIAVNRTPNRFEIGDIGVLPDVHPHVRTVQSGGAAEKAGMQANDVVASIDGKTITFASQLKDAIAKHPEQTITMSILRGGQPVTLKATPERHGDEGLLGISILDDLISQKPGLGEALTMSVQRNIEYGGKILQTVLGMITPQA